MQQEGRANLIQVAVDCNILVWPVAYAPAARQLSAVLHAAATQWRSAPKSEIACLCLGVPTVDRTGLVRVDDKGVHTHSHRLSLPEHLRPAQVFLAGLGPLV